MYSKFEMWTSEYSLSFASRLNRRSFCCRLRHLGSKLQSSPISGTKQWPRSNLGGVL